jgi:hypothetical protein
MTASLRTRSTRVFVQGDEPAAAGLVSEDAYPLSARRSSSSKGRLGMTRSRYIAVVLDGVARNERDTAISRKVDEVLEQIGNQDLSSVALFRRARRDEGTRTLPARPPLRQSARATPAPSNPELRRGPRRTRACVACRPRPSA